MNDLFVVVKPGAELTPYEIQIIDEDSAREWNLPPRSRENREKHIVVLVKDEQEKVLAHGQLFPLPNVIFNHEKFSLIEIGGIIAHIKGKGYGKKLMEGIKQYLKDQQKTGIGFTSLENIGFYEKCGFNRDDTSLSRFLNYQELTGDEEESIFYLDSSDHFMEKVLNTPEEDVYLFGK